MIPYSALPTINATLNAASAVLLGTGYTFIRKGKIGHHLVCMLSAFFLSCLFLVSYVTYHAHAGSVHYQGIGLIRKVYFTILISHTILAALIVPLILRTLYLALHARFIEHRRIARWTFPIWLYVSITGVVIYEMLY
jgi:putative membrane protein